MLAVAVAGDAAAEARVGVETSTGTLAVSVDTRNSPDGNHPLLLHAYSGPSDRGFVVETLAGFAAAPLVGVDPCTLESTTFGQAVRCRNAQVRLVRAVLGDGGDVVALEEREFIRPYATLCEVGDPDPDTTDVVRAEVRLGAGNDRLTARGRVCAGFWSRDDISWAINAFGQAGNDRLQGDWINDLLDGGDGADTLLGGLGGDTLHGGAGADSVEGGAGADTVRGGSGDDRLDGGDGADAILGETDRDTLLGGAGDDLLDGGTGNDDLAGGDGDDTLRGGTGNDDLAAGPGHDTLDGGDGILDEVSYESETRPVVVTLADAAANDGVVVGGVSERDSVIRVESVTGGHVGDTITGSVALNVLRGEGGDDILRGLGSRDFLSGSDGNDQLFGDDGNDDLRGEAGADQLSGGAGDDRLDGGDGNDGLRGDAGSDLFVGGRGGRNLMLARDGEADRFDCSLGIDEVQADLLDSVPAACETVDRYALDDGPPGRATGTSIIIGGTNAAEVLVACPAQARVSCRGDLRLASLTDLATALATSAPYTIPIGSSALVALAIPASAATALIQQGSAALITNEQGATTTRQARRTLPIVRG